MREKEREREPRKRGREREKTEIDRRGSKCDRVATVGVAMTSWMWKRKGG